MPLNFKSPGWIILAFIFVVSTGFAIAATIVNDNSITTEEVNTILYVDQNSGSDIQVKIDAADNGDKIIIPAGVYTLTSRIVVNKPITIEGSGYSTIINQTGNDDIILINNTRDVTIRDIYFIQSGDEDGIEMRGLNNSLIERVVVEGNHVVPAVERFGISMRNTIGCTLTHNEVFGSIWDAGIRVDATLPLVRAEHNTVSHNYLHDLGTSGLGGSIASGTGIENEVNQETNKSFMNVFANNHVWDTNGYGIRIIQCNQCIIEGNAISNSTFAGVWLKDTNHTLVTNNNINGIVGQCIELTATANYNSVTNNYIKECTASGILIKSASDNNNIQGNYLYGENISDAGDLTSISLNFNGISRYKEISGLMQLDYDTTGTVLIVGGNITVNGSYMNIDSEGASGDDNVSCILGGTNGQVLYLRQANDARDITYMHRDCSRDGQRMMIRNKTTSTSRGDYLNVDTTELMRCFYLDNSEGWACDPY